MVLGGLLGLVALVPLLLALYECNRTTALKLGAIFGLLVGSFMYWGVISYSVPVFCLIIIVFTSVFAMTCLLFQLALRKRALVAPLLVGLVWAIHEMLLQALGLPYSYLILVNHLPEALQSLRYVGQFALSGLLLSLQAALALFLSEPRQRNALSLTNILPMVVVIFTSWFIPPPSGTEDLKISVVQTNNHPKLHINKAADGVLERSIERRNQLMNEIPTDRQLVVWPESSVLGYELRHRTRAQQLGKAVHLVSAPDLDSQGFRYSRVFSIDSQLGVIDTSGKGRLIPLIEGAYSQASDDAIHSATPGSPTVYVCYESAFTRTLRASNDLPDELQGNGERRGITSPIKPKKPAKPISIEPPGQEDRSGSSAVIVIATSDAFAGPSILPELHQRFSAIRAIESNRFVLRAANGGISSIIDNRGRVLNSLPLYKSGVMNQTISLINVRSPYVKFQLFWSWGLLAAGIVAIGICLVPSRSPGKNGEAQISIVETRATPLSSLSHIKLVAAIALCISSLIIMQIIWASWQFNQVANHEENFSSQGRSSRWNLHSPFFRSAIAPDEFSYHRTLVEQQSDSLLSAVTFVLRTYGEPIDTPMLIALADDQAEQRISETDLLDKGRKAVNHFGYVWHDVDLLTDTITLPLIAIAANGEFVVVEKITSNQIEAFSPLHGKLILPKHFLASGLLVPQAIFIGTARQPWE